MNIYVGNISFDSTDDDLRSAFEKFGEVVSANVIKDRDSGRSRGFGFVEMTSDDEASKAISELNETDLDGRTIKVNQARPRGNRSGGGGGGNRGGGNRGGGGSW